MGLIPSSRAIYFSKRTPSRYLTLRLDGSGFSKLTKRLTAAGGPGAPETGLLGWAVNIGVLELVWGFHDFPFQLERG